MHLSRRAGDEERLSPQPQMAGSASEPPNSATLAAEAYCAAIAARMSLLPQTDEVQAQLAWRREPHLLWEALGRCGVRKEDCRRLWRASCQLVLCADWAGDLGQLQERSAAQRVAVFALV